MTDSLQGHKARKRFGQNFLEDDNVIQNIISVISPQYGQKMVEIGPGLGALTRYLLPAVKRLDVIELDRDLAARLPKTLAGLGELHLHQADALNFDFSQLIENEQKLRVVGNLPYNISTPLIFHLLSHSHLISDMAFMLQKEVVDRLGAEPDTADYGRLSVMVQYRCQVDWLLGVPPEAFNPAPKVQSAVVKLTPWQKSPYNCDNEALLQRVVSTAFNQRRKTLRNCLKGLAEAPDFEAVGINPSLRAEVLSVQQFVQLTNQLNKHV
ncbi:MAG: 16S rRNA (adenine(1518)-N(6)/adenine(1519)-N(6))-dimethyltransferase RsmA [Agitococcus sp.]|jgi:16S rRNA (adenine1518-N6/adenine1519-N6)-dimethyltransferase|nr:16S rRNA (adenine(1518)-N(6)/adenine(1519)-N(6))-dimethyltransferase RsmA [Moraxellaceae bacterium]MBK8326830.1 16S rRNA (adenine(1518)-N(6)/adenine(1519)-N(6))-dimethyltransferase RsmA [Moraxellaceae bacterium]MBP9215680.1 16S rRNA (adenine(1518)-N(6)/adenine(1519)-N(6))-dimethyltransferase RsmA [Agitococcus sp.]HQV80226.1 16S rRNA (adenine(1518)-N(6)/adenine(1519)-N(6))-dimethyltransferase RsmA [Agitococcus sp.]